MPNGNFLTEDSYLGNITDPLTLNRYNYVKSSPLNYIDPSGHKTKEEYYITDSLPEVTWISETWTGAELVFKVGEPERPEWEKYKQYDADFEYDPDAKAKISDYANWARWGTEALGAKLIDPSIDRNLEDGLLTYYHYRDASGEDFHIDYEKAYLEDSAIKTSLDNYLFNIIEAIDKIAQETVMGCSFSLTSNLLPGGIYPVTENWQKAIGGHSIWISADVQISTSKEVSAKIIIHELDRYNFNRNNKDIASGAKDEVNRRFEELGWAKSFNSFGEVTFDASWLLGDVETINTALKENTNRITN